MTTTPVTPARRSSPRPAVGGLVVAVLAGAAWFGWMGWDEEYQVDPVTGVGSGPYEAWQVIGCVVSLLVVFVAALLLGVRPLVAAPALTIAFAAAWATTEAPRDGDGLFAVGLVLLVVGLASSTTVIALVVLGLRHLLRRPLRPVVRTGTAGVGR